MSAELQLLTHCCLCDTFLSLFNFSFFNKRFGGELGYGNKGRVRENMTGRAGLEATMCAISESDWKSKVKINRLVISEQYCNFYQFLVALYSIQCHRNHAPTMYLSGNTTSTQLFYCFMTFLTRTSLDLHFLNINTIMMSVTGV